MCKIIYFENENQTQDRCAGQTYCNFLDYAFSQTNYFMLVYVNYYGKGYSKTTKQIMKELQAFKVKSRTNPSWPGTLNTFANNTTYKIVFYRNCDEAKEILKQVNCLSDWSYPVYPQDLAFFKNGECWFYSVAHEKIGAVIGATERDLDFLELNNLAKRSNAKKVDDYYKAFNEEI